MFTYVYTLLEIFVFINTKNMKLQDAWKKVKRGPTNWLTDQQTDRPTDWWTNKTGCRVAYMRLKSLHQNMTIFLAWQSRFCGRRFTHDTLSTVWRVRVKAFRCQMGWNGSDGMRGRFTMCAMRTPGEESIPSNANKVNKQDTMRRRHECEIKNLWLKTWRRYLLVRWWIRRRGGMKGRRGRKEEGEPGQERIWLYQWFVGRHRKIFGEQEVVINPRERIWTQTWTAGHNL